MEAIDAVIPWVDGNDPVLNAKRRAHMKGGAEGRSNEVGGATRYKSVGEIAYCVASILRFAPFIRHIYIVTDGQDPGLGPMLESRFPGRAGDVSIIDHKLIFRGREDYLPTFNSNSIETLIHNIPGLAEKFILFNDDMFLIRETTPEDFYRPDGKVVCYGRWRSEHHKSYLAWLMPSSYSVKKTGWFCFLNNGKNLVSNEEWYIYLAHSPRALLKSWYERNLAEHPEWIELNCRTKFRSNSQWEAQETFYISMHQQDRLVLLPGHEHGLYLKGKPFMSGIPQKLRQFDAESSGRFFLCANSLDQSPRREIDAFLSWLSRKIG